jgi:predicted RNA polymerase sigma factor
MSTDVRRTIETVWRIESARLIASLARITRDVDSPRSSRSVSSLLMTRWASHALPSDVRNAGHRLSAHAVRRHLVAVRNRQRVHRRTTT